MGPEIMEVVVGEREREFVRMVSSKSLEMAYIEKAHAQHDWNEVDEMLKAWLLHGEDKSVAIHNAVKYGHPHLVVDNYIRFQAEIDIGTLISSYTLHLAAEAGYYKVVRLLVKDCGMNKPERLHELINGQDSRLWTALHWACQNGHTHVVKILLKWICENSLELPTATEILEGTEFTTPLHLAIKPSGSGEIPRGVIAKSERRSRVALVDALLISPEGSELLNMKDWQGNTALHLAVETMNVDVVEMLIKQPRLIATVRNSRGKTPSGLVWDLTHSDQTKGLESVKIIQKYLTKLPDVQEEHEVLIDSRARYYNAANNLLVGGALLAQVTFSGILSMVVLPQEFLTDTCQDSLAPSPGLSPSPAPSPDLPSTSPPCTNHQTRVKDMMEYKIFYVRAIDVFRGSNNLSFYFAIVTIMAAIRLIISRGQNIPLESEISRLRTSTILISLSLTFSTIFAVVAFISGGLAKIPVAESGWGYVLMQWTRGKSVAVLKSTMLTTTMVGLVLIIPFILLHLLLDDFAIFRAYLDTKLDSWDAHHAKWAVGSWRPFLTLLLATLFLVATLFIMLLLIFGVGLLQDYIKPPPKE